MAGKIGVGYTPGSGAEIAGWLDSSGNAHQSTLLEYLPTSAGTPDPLMISPDNPMPINLVAGGVLAGTVTAPSGDILSVTPQPSIFPGSSLARVQSQGSSINAVSLKAGAGVILTYAFFNNATSQRVIRFYNLAAAPSPGATAGIVGKILLQGGQAANLDMPSGGMPFSVGIAYNVTAGVADNDQSNTTLDDVNGFIVWK